MDSYYLVLLGFLAVIAVIDLFVGVSNDAVNFLNSALGCRIARFRTTMWVATAGVMLGATFSSGMMEIARSGVFNPQMFSFAEIMVIFFAVMTADIILLDAFNSLGLPTSTTVSIVFELLGSAIAAACFKLVADGASLADVANYINNSKALAIISGILISVAVAFVTGALVQYLARLVFSFKFEGAYRKVGAIYGGIAITAIIYFLVMKGAKGASFMRPEWIAWINANTTVILATLFTGLTALFQAMISLWRINVFKIIILAGTFSLAFAFAGNDLVNFVGVPLAAYDSWQQWSASGASDATFMMGGLLKASTAPTSFLLLSGLVMVLTLWFSRKARRVIEASISLSSSQTGEQERFGASMPGRMIVRASMAVGGVLDQIIPAAMRRSLASRFEPAPVKEGEAPLPFDYVRASINLVVSAILIASATSLKLLLSTTYVTFMVAMGSSFADGAWDRETAVYRISGVLTVISGWFLTALCASTLAGVVATLVLWGGEAMACVLGVVAIALLVRSNFRAEDDGSLEGKGGRRIDAASVRDMLAEMTPANLASTLSIAGDVLNGLLSDRESQLRQAKAEASEFFEKLSAQRAVYYRMALADKHPSDADFEARYCYFRACTNMREVGRSLQSLARLSLEHVANRHRPFEGRLAEDLEELVAMLDALGRASADTKPEALQKTARLALSRIDALQSKVIRSIPEESLSIRATELYLAFLLFARDLINHYEIATLIRARIAVEGDAPAVASAGLSTAAAEI